MRRRQAFTIVELLVAMALIVFIMYILAEAFSAGATAFRNLKAVGDMNEKLRTTTTVLRKYLGSDYEIRSFERVMSAFSGKVINSSDAITWRSVSSKKVTA